MQYYKPMKLAYVLALLYFSSCTNQNNFITEYINLIGKNGKGDSEMKFLQIYKENTL
ncbi:hypothetical protein FACS189450_06260 [Spirochaetia bacterium]|nr:hypothetical protein FACS189450_06260 [Spirochaetia bacterium]